MIQCYSHRIHETISPLTIGHSVWKIFKLEKT